jgi:HEAT repeat protein
MSGCDVDSGLQKTWNVLTQTRNRAAVPTLLAALESQAAEIRTGGIRACVHRKDPSGHAELVRRYSTLSEEEQALVSELQRDMPHRMASALRAAVLGGDAVTCENACRIILSCHDYEQFPALVRAAENRRHRHAAQVNSAMLQLANRLRSDLVEHAAVLHHGSRGPAFLHRQAVSALERAVSSYQQHQRLEIVEAFLLVAPADNDLLRRILDDVHHPCHQPAVSSLLGSKVPAMMEQLGALLHDPSVPKIALEIIARRADKRFLESLLHRMKLPVPLRVLQNMKRLRWAAWLEGQRQILLELDGRAQAAAVELAVGSGIDRDAVFELLATLLRRGAAEGRRASCRALAAFRRPEAGKLVLEALADPDPGVEAAAAMQLRDRNTPDALPTLVALLDSPSKEVADAARSSLAEFNFVRYRAMFDALDEKTLQTTGMLVRKVDPSSLFRLKEELTSQSTATRRRGIAIARAMQFTDDVREHLIVLAEDDEVVVRLDAVTALGLCHGQEVKTALHLAAQDPRQSVREAAEKSLAQVEARDWTNGSRPPLGEKQP